MAPPNHRELPDARRVDLAGALAALARGEIVAYPTETFYGLAVDASDPAALCRLTDWKGRGAEKTFGLIITRARAGAGTRSAAAGASMLDAICAEIPPVAARLMAAHWPGPLTLALPARAEVPEVLVRDGCVAVRESPHPVAWALAAGFGRAITATSANRAGEAAARTGAEAAALPTGCWVLDGGDCPGGLPSTLVRVRGERFEILRQGAISAEAVAAAAQAP